jgi:membrane-associated phospholipid phosphatase
MNFSRVAWWIHWFFDIVAWAIIGLLSSLFIFKYLKNTKILKQINTFIIKIMNKIKL